jgi:glyoxylase-like metal-dependent hydrolase (beta-lactamase superfamily II)
MKRRDFIKQTMQWGAMAVGASALNPVYASTDFEIPADPMYDVPPTKVTEHCYYILAKDPEPTPENHAFFNNPGFIVTEKGVVVIDTGSSVQIGEMVLRQIKKVTDKPVVMVINTHYHGDHFLGNHAFVKHSPNTPIYAHEACINKIKGGAGEFWYDFMQRNSNNAITGTVVTLPNKKLAGGERFDMGDVTLNIHQFGTAHTESDLIIEVEEKQSGIKSAYLGDTAMRRIANMSDGSFPGTIETMKRCQDLNCKHYIVGHGRHDDVSIVKDMQKFCEIIWNNCQKYYDEGLSDFEIKPKIMADPFMQKVVSQWPGYDSTLGKFVSVAVQEVEKSMF